MSFSLKAVLTSQVRDNRSTALDQSAYKEQSKICISDNKIPESKDTHPSNSASDLTKKDNPGNNQYAPSQRLQFMVDGHQTESHGIVRWNLHHSISERSIYSSRSR